MGGITSKFFKSSNETPVKQKSNVILCDPRSPTVGVDRTPIIINNERTYLETNFDVADSPCTHRISKPWPLSKRIYKNLGIDPRTAELFVPGAAPRNYEVFDTPTSSYSCNVSQVNDTNLTEPAEPSVVVSDFEDGDESDYQEMFMQQIDQLITKLTETDVTIEDSSMKQEPVCNTEDEEQEVSPAKLSLQEIEDKIIEDLEQLENTTSQLEHEECVVKHDKSPEIQTQLPKTKSLKNIKKAKTSVQKIQKQINNENTKTTPPHLSKIPVKSSKPRTPLGNITTSANSPVQMLKVKNSNLKNKICITGVENNVENFNKNPVIGQWDQETTLII